MNQHTNQLAFARSDVDTVTEKPLYGVHSRHDVVRDVVHDVVTDCDQTKSKPVSGNQEQNSFPPYPNAVSNRENIA